MVQILKFWYSGTMNLKSEIIIIWNILEWIGL
jgi:hypothetical protein